MPTDPIEPVRPKANIRFQSLTCLESNVVSCCDMLSHFTCLFHVTPYKSHISGMW